MAHRGQFGAVKAVRNGPQVVPDGVACVTTFE